MGNKFYTPLAYGTLVIDAYLALGCVATEMMPPEGLRYLPPFGWLIVSHLSRFVTMSVATWTAILALGCLRVSNGERKKARFAGLLWFVVVLALIWLYFLVPLIDHFLDILWEAFVRGV